MKIGDVKLKGLSSLHLTSADGSSAATLFCENTNFTQVSSLSSLSISASSFENSTAINEIMNLQINDTIEGYRIIGEQSAFLDLNENNDTNEKSMVVTKTNDDGDIISYVSAFTTLSTVCKGIQEIVYKMVDLEDRIVELENKLNNM